MSKTRKVALLMIAAILSSLLGAGELLAGGGVFPIYPGDVGFTLNTSAGITALIVLDPNGPVTTGPPATSTGTLGAIALTRGNDTVTGVFQVEPSSSLGELRYGCNLLLTNTRFVEFSGFGPGLLLGGPVSSSFFNWLPPSLTLKLFSELGVDLVNPSLKLPGITSVISQQCVPFPNGQKDVDLALFKQVTEALHLPGPLQPNPIKPTKPAYPDRTIDGSPPPEQQWYPGILVLQVNIGLWEQ